MITRLKKNYFRVVNGLSWAGFATALSIGVLTTIEIIKLEARGDCGLGIGLTALIGVGGTVLVSAVVAVLFGLQEIGARNASMPVRAWLAEQPKRFYGPIVGASVLFAVSGLSWFIWFN